MPGREQGVYSPVTPLPSSPTEQPLLLGVLSMDICLFQAESFDNNTNVAVLPSAAKSESQDPAYDFLQQIFLNLLDNCSYRVSEFRCVKTLQKQILPSISVNAHQCFIFMKSKHQHSGPQSFTARRYDIHILTVRRLAAWPLPSTHMPLIFPEIQALFYKIISHFCRQSQPKKRWHQGMCISCNTLDVNSEVLSGL